MINKNKFISSILLATTISACHSSNNISQLRAKIKPQKQMFAKVIDPLAPVLTVVSPAADQSFATGTVLIQITTDRSTPLVTLNGKTMTTTNNLNFTATYEVPYDGKFKLIALGAVSGHQGQAEVTFEINRSNTDLWQYEQCPL